MHARKFVLATVCQGMPKLSDFKIVEETLPELQDEELEGFIVTRWAKEWFGGLDQLRDWIIEGKIKVQETRVDGFENMPQAFIDLLQGKNTGKLIVKA